ncbi:carbohydrate ABC transporter permease [Mediterraneibacter agrestimuris]|uniref:carbohydrate ABC transporter permease n=1 Tax=Mediterraneibacter agrestimuris TaxID=2941333 RepID=UPI00203DD3B9|nr:carbohydrate ABC transporter permease [Mediterraneibacter agrestimuris]
MRKNKVTAGRLGSYVVLILVAVFCAFPLIYAFFGSFKSSVEFLNGGSNILPEVWDFSSYTKAWEEANFAQYTINSLVISGVTVVLTLVVGSMAAYVLARTTFRAKPALVAVLGLVMFIPNVVLIFPIFNMCQRLHLMGNIWSIIITQTASGLPFLVMLMQSYMVSISKEIDEAAEMDGCSFFRKFYLIILPLSKPILATVALFAFKNAWNSYLLPLALSLSKPEIQPLTVGVIALKDMGEGISAWNIMIAGSVLSIFPMVIVYLFMNRYFVEGLTAGSVKG